MKRAFIRLFGCILSAIGLSMSYDTTMTVILGEDAAPGAAWAASGSGDTGSGDTGWATLPTSSDVYRSGTCVANPDDWWSFKYKYQRWYIPYYGMVMGEGNKPSSATASLNEPYNPNNHTWSGYTVNPVYINPSEGGNLCAVVKNNIDPGVLDDFISQYGVSGTGNCFSIYYGDRTVYYSPIRSAFERMGCQYVNTNGEGIETYTGTTGTTGTGSGVSAAYCYFSEASTLSPYVGHAVFVRRIFERCGSSSYWPSSSSVSIVPEGFWLDTPIWGDGGYDGGVVEQGCPEEVGEETSWSENFAGDGDEVSAGEYFCEQCPTYSKTSDLISYSNLEYKSNGGTGITSCKINLVGGDSVGTFVYSPDCGYTQ